MSRPLHTVLDDIERTEARCKSLCLSIGNDLDGIHRSLDEGIVAVSLSTDQAKELQVRLVALMQATNELYDIVAATPKYILDAQADSEWVRARCARSPVLAMHWDAARDRVTA